MMKRNRITATVLCGILLSGAVQSLPAGAVTLRAQDAFSVQAPTETALPAQYDMRKAGLTTRVQKQSGYGMCWSFASLGSLESTMVSRYPDVDLSEWALAYYAYSPTFGFPLSEDVSDDTAAFRMGGNFYVASPMLTGWFAPASESEMPFGDMTVLDAALPAADLQAKSAWHVTDAEIFMNDVDARITDSVRSQVKSAVYSGQAVAMSYYNNTKYYAAGNLCYYNADNTRTGGNYHAVTIVGWDGDYPAANFPTAPSANGAFLCKNSWGPAWGDAGYFWVSYEEPSVVELYAIRGEEKQKHTGQYRYDDYGYWTAMSVDESDTSAYAANIFTAAEDTCVTAVTFVTPLPEESYAIRVYKNVQDAADPTSGTSNGRTRGTISVPGYHTVTLDNPVFLSAGEKFSVVVHLAGAAGQHIACEAYTCFTTEHSDGTVEKNESLLDEATIDRDFHAGESFYSLDGKKWYDMFKEEITDEDITDATTGEKTHVYGKVGNVCVRALTQEIGRVVFSDYANAVPLGTQITLSCPGAEEIWYRTDANASFTQYTAPIEVTDAVTVETYAVRGGVNTPTVSHSYAVQTAQLSTLLRTDTSEYLTLERLSDDCWTAVCTGGETPELMPVTTAAITSESGEFASGTRTQVTAENALILHTQQENMRDGLYVIYLTDVILGNVNLDESVNAADAADVLIYAAENGAGAAEGYDAAWLDRADYDRSGGVDAVDAAGILQYAAEQGAN